MTIKNCKNLNNNKNTSLTMLLLFAKTETSQREDNNINKMNDNH